MPKTKSRDPEFEIRFFESVLRRAPNYANVVELLGGLYTRHGRIADGLRMDRKLVKLHDFDEGEPYAFVECVPTIFPVKGSSTPLSPGAVFEYEVPDIYGRPWAHNWRKYWERGMEVPQQDDLFKF